VGEKLRRVRGEQTMEKAANLIDGGATASYYYGPLQPQ
jgi:hypothetical protein